jgi:hypothetical protein
MELTLTISDQTARKIKALSILDSLSAEEISSLIESSVEQALNVRLAGTLGLTTQTTTVSIPSCWPAQHPLEQEIVQRFENVVPGQGLTTTNSGAQVFSSDEDDEEMESLADDVVDEHPSMDQELDDDTKQEFAQMVVKNKQGEEEGYDDDFMADVQAMAEDDDGQGDSIFRDAAGSVDKKTFTGRSTLPSDSPIDDSGMEGTDILPVDFNIDSIAGDPRASADFFTKAMFGQRGETRNRDQVRQKKHKGLYL